MTNNLGVAVVLVDQNQVLLAKRKNAYGAGLWGCPGGRVADSESVEQTVKHPFFQDHCLRVVWHKRQELL